MTKDENLDREPVFSHEDLRKGNKIFILDSYECYGVQKWSDKLWLPPAVSHDVHIPYGLIINKLLACTGCTRYV